MLSLEKRDDFMADKGFDKGSTDSKISIQGMILGASKH